MKAKLLSEKWKNFTDFSANIKPSCLFKRTLSWEDRQNKTKMYHCAKKTLWFNSTNEMLFNYMHHKPSNNAPGILIKTHETTFFVLI